MKKNGFVLERSSGGWTFMICVEGEEIVDSRLIYKDKREAFSAIARIADVIEDTTLEDADSILIHVQEFDASGVYVETHTRTRVNKDGK